MFRIEIWIKLQINLSIKNCSRNWRIKNAFQNVRRVLLKNSNPKFQMKSKVVKTRVKILCIKPFTPDNGTELLLFSRLVIMNVIYDL